ncbi:MAG TPA: hypothetical protein VK488_06450 [Gaiellaceae bacterium]|nr:hypothetical protein [Gaiellaceae bacterium]
MRSAALITIILAGLGGVGCKGQPVKLKSNSSLEEARAYERFPVYYAGDKVAGLPLTAVNREPVTAPPGTPTAPKIRKARGVSSFEFDYGSCVVPSGAEGSCSLPLNIQVWPACAHYPALYRQGLGSPVPRKTRIRGVPAAYFEGGYRLEVQTGASTIVIFGKRARMRAAVAALEGLNVNVAPGQRLPPPVPGALDGSLPCA